MDQSKRLSRDSLLNYSFQLNLSCQYSFLSATDNKQTHISSLHDWQDLIHIVNLTFETEERYSAVTGSITSFYIKCQGGFQFMKAGVLLSPTHTYWTQSFPSLYACWISPLCLYWSGLCGLSWSNTKMCIKKLIHTIIIQEKVTIFAMHIHQWCCTTTQCCYLYWLLVWSLNLNNLVLHRPQWRITLLKIIKRKINKAT